MRIPLRHLVRGWSCAGLAMLLVSAAVRAPRANEVRAADVSAPLVSGPVERTFFIGSGASTADAVEFRDRLRDLGARNVNLFLPDGVIVCDLPLAVRSAVNVPAAFRAERAQDVTAPGARIVSASWGWIAEAYARKDRGETFTSAPAYRTGEPPFDDVVLTISPERIAAIRAEIARYAPDSNLEPRPQPARDANQNSEFLGGTILANFLFAESDGSGETDTETWSDDDLREAKIGAFQAMQSWQDRWPTMDMAFTVVNYERVPTRYEPILHFMGSDALWIVDVMRALGWGLSSNDPLVAVHEFNEAKRAEYHTQWTFSSFIAYSRNVTNHRFGNGNATYTAYAYLGGPYMVEPFPAGTDPNAVGETLVFSQIVNHEVGHNFYTLDEYAGSPSPCPETSGYLNYPNMNVTTIDPGGSQLRCTTPQDCIMDVAARQNLGRPWCTYSQGHLGVADANGNGMPDLFEAAPTVEFAIAGPETVTTNDFTLRFRAVSQAVPNKNSRIDPAHRVDYAAKLRRGWFSLGQSQYTLPADDGKWDELSEDVTFPISLAQVGQTVLTVQLENAVGFKSAVYVKKVYFTGVNYSRAAATVKPAKIVVSWETAGDVFDTHFNVYRLDPGQAKPGTKLNLADIPKGTGTGGFTPYEYTDRAIEAGKDYRYYVEGVFTLPFEGGNQEYHSPSNVIAQTAMIPDFNAAPNPTRGEVKLSLSVPPTYGGTARAPTRLATPLEVAVYDVRGGLVRRLRKGSSLDEIVTLKWDGRDDNNQPAPSGVYFVRAQVGSAPTTVHKIVLIR